MNHNRLSLFTDSTMAQFDIEIFSIGKPLASEVESSRKNLQVTFLDIGEGTPGVETFCDKDVQVLLKAKSLQDWLNVCHSSVSCFMGSICETVRSVINTTFPVAIYQAVVRYCQSTQHSCEWKRWKDKDFW